MTDSLGRQFDAPKRRWVPDQMGDDISWHVLRWHTVGRGPSNGKSIGNGHDPSMQDHEQWHKKHMQMHENSKFEVGHEHDHFTPKNRK